MYLESVRFLNVRSFEDTGLIKLSKGINILIGPSNAGKTTILKGILSLQQQGLDGSDARFDSMGSEILLDFANFDNNLPLDGIQLSVPRGQLGYEVAVKVGYQLNDTAGGDYEGRIALKAPKRFFLNRRPHNVFLPYHSQRAAAVLQDSIAEDVANSIDGTHSNLVSRLDNLITARGNIKSKNYEKISQELLGVTIATRSFGTGKRAGVYSATGHLIPLNKMGDGVLNTAGFITDLVEATGKIFLIEEIEAGLHPSLLKSLLTHIIESAKYNQFVISTHSNIVLRALSFIPDTKIFETVPGSTINEPSRVLEVPATPQEYRRVLEELGYDFSDVGLYMAYLILEESSAERIIRDVLIPNFSPCLLGRLRTYASKGASNVPSRVNDLLNLMTFIHLEPMYERRLWVRVDNGEAGKGVLAKLADHQDRIDADCFSEDQFESYYPARYAADIEAIAAEGNSRKASELKGDLAERAVKDFANDQTLAEGWKESAAEIIDFLKSVEENLARER